MPHKFNPAHMARLESEDRRRRMPPEPLLAGLGLRSGSVLADVGCGPGFYALPAAAIVGPNGRVYAMDIQQEMIARVAERAAAAGHAHVTALLCGESALPLPDATADVVLVANVLHEAEDQAAFLAEVARILKPGGRLGVVEWRRVPMEVGPPLEERMTEEEVDAAMAAAGLQAPAAMTGTPETHFARIAARP